MTNKRFISVFITMFLLFVAVLGSAGCGGGDSSKPADDEPNTPIQRPEPNPVPDNDPTPVPIVSPDPVPVPVSYTVTFNSNGGSSISSITVSSGKTVTKPRDPSKTGYTFGGWYKDSALTQAFRFGSDGDKVTSNITLYAKWNISDRLRAETALGKISIGYRDGDSSEHVTGNLLLPSNVDVSGDQLNISWTSSNPDVISTRGAVTRQNRNVTVRLNAKVSSGSISRSKTFSLTVIRVETPVPLSYTVSFNSNGGSSVSSITVPSGDTVTKPTDPSKTGYTFGGWYKDSSLTQIFRFGSGGDKVTSNITLYAKWNISDSLRAETALGKISIGYQDGDSAEHVTENLTLPSHVDVSGDRFSIVWASNKPDVISSNGTVKRSSSDVSVSLSATVTIGTVRRSATFNVKVIRTSTLSGYTVSFDSKGGSTVQSIRVSPGSTVAMPEAPTRTGYVFAGWYKDERFTQIFQFGENGDKITQDIKLYARWVDPEELLANYALSEIVIGYSHGDNPYYVTRNLTLPSKVYTAEFNGVESVDIVWSSNQPGIISSAGNVTRQNGSDVNVTLKATVSTKNEVVSRDFNLRVVRKTSRSASEIPTVTVDDINEMNNGNSETNIAYGNGKQIVDIDGTFCGFKVFNAEDAQDAVHGIHEAMGINDTYSELVFDGAASTDTGVKYCFAQYYDNAVVYGRRVLVSANTGNNTSFMMSSFLSSDILARSDLSANITKEQAEAIAKSYHAGSFDVLTDFTRKIIYSLEDYEDNPVPAFALVVTGWTDTEEYISEAFIVNAKNGEVIANTPIGSSALIHVEFNGEGKNEFGYDVEFPVNAEYGAIHPLPILVFGHYMHDYETNVQVYEPASIALLDITANPVHDRWDAQQVSAYTNMISIMRWWKTKFGRDSLDGKGMKVNVVTHAKGDEENAAWDYLQERISIYDNKTSTSKIHSLAAASDVLAHETTHAVIDYGISGGWWNALLGQFNIDWHRFPNQNATGAIEEAYCDIFACIYDSQDWTMAEDSYPRGKCIRDVANPGNESAYNYLAINPMFTVGEAYCEYKTVKPEGGTSGNDNNHVHQYSLIVSHAAYLMHKYGMPYDLLGRLWYNTIYKGAYDAASNFYSVRNVVLKAARENNALRGYIKIIERAFDEVGITEGAYHFLKVTVSDVSDPDHKISYGDVTISRDNTIYSMSSGNDGTRTMMLQAGTYTINAKAQGFFPSSRTIEISPLSGDVDIEVSLLPEPYNEIKGHIYSSDRVTPIEGAIIRITSGHNNPNGETIDETETGYDGYYHLTLEYKGAEDYTITITKDGLTDYFNVTVNGVVTKDWYFLSDNEPNDPAPVSSDVPIVSYDIPIDEAHFPDDVFRKYVSYKIDNNRDGILSKTEIESTVHIDVSEIDIWNFDYNDEINFTQSLKGVEYLAALQSLDCSDSQLTNLNVSKNTALRELRCDGSSITALSLSGCTALEILNCDKCQLTTLDVSSCTALKILYCSKNQLTALNVNKNTSLQVLECYENLLTTLDVSNNTSLETLYCSSNQLKALDVSNHEDLKYLYCNDNQLATLDISDCSSLIFLDCHNNQLIALDVSDYTALMLLNCNNCRLTTLNVNNCTSLVELRCANNQLTMLDVSDLSTLQLLACNSNQLTTLDVSGTGLGELWCNDNQLTTLDLSDCFLLGQYKNNVHCDDDLRANIIWTPDTSATMSAKRTSSPSALSVSINDSAEILAVLPAFTPEYTGTYTLTVSLDRELPEVSSLVLIVDSKDMHGLFTKTENPMLVRVSANFSKGRTYTPIIATMPECEKQIGGCNIGSIGMILITGIMAMIAKKL